MSDERADIVQTKYHNTSLVSWDDSYSGELASSGVSGLVTKRTMNTHGRLGCVHICMHNNICYRHDSRGKYPRSTMKSSVKSSLFHSVCTLDDEQRPGQSSSSSGSYEQAPSESSSSKKRRTEGMPAQEAAATTD